MKLIFKESKCELPKPLTEGQPVIPVSLEYFIEQQNIKKNKERELKNKHDNFKIINKINKEQ